MNIEFIVSKAYIFDQQTIGYCVRDNAESHRIVLEIKEICARRKIPNPSYSVSRGVLEFDNGSHIQFIYANRPSYNARGYRFDLVVGEGMVSEEIQQILKFSRKTDSQELYNKSWEERVDQTAEEILGSKERVDELMKELDKDAKLAIISAFKVGVMLIAGVVCLFALDLI